MQLRAVSFGLAQIGPVECGDVNVATGRFPKPVRPIFTQPWHNCRDRAAIDMLDMDSACRKFGQHIVGQRQMLGGADVQRAASVHQWAIMEIGGWHGQKRA